MLLKLGLSVISLSSDINATLAPLRAPLRRAAAPVLRRNVAFQTIPLQPQAPEVQKQMNVLRNFNSEPINFDSTNSVVRGIQYTQPLSPLLLLLLSGFAVGSQVECAANCQELTEPKDNDDLTSWLQAYTSRLTYIFPQSLPLNGDKKGRQEVMNLLETVEREVYEAMADAKFGSLSPWETKNLLRQRLIQEQLENLIRKSPSAKSYLTYNFQLDKTYDLFYKARKETSEWFTSSKYRPIQNWWLKQALFLDEKAKNFAANNSQLEYQTAPALAQLEYNFALTKLIAEGKLRLKLSVEDEARLLKLPVEKAERMLLRYIQTAAASLDYNQRDQSQIEIFNKGFIKSLNKKLYDYYQAKNTFGVQILDQTSPEYKDGEQRFKEMLRRLTVELEGDNYNSDIVQPQLDMNFFKQLNKKLTLEQILANAKDLNKFQQDDKKQFLQQLLAARWMEMKAVDRPGLVKRCWRRFAYLMVAIFGHGEAREFFLREYFFSLATLRTRLNMKKKKAVQEVVEDK